MDVQKNSLLAISFIMVFLITGYLIQRPVLAGSLEPPPDAVDASGNPVPTMHTLDQIFYGAEYLTCDAGIGFLDNSDGTVTDCTTGLVWMKDTYGINHSSWESAMTKCAELETKKGGVFDGSSPGDWRLPSTSELLSLVDLTYRKPALHNTDATKQWSEGDPFLNVMAALPPYPPKYWSSEIEQTGCDETWGCRADYLSVIEGSVGKSYLVDLTTGWDALHKVWCVRDPF